MIFLGFYAIIFPMNQDDLIQSLLDKMHAMFNANVVFDPKNGKQVDRSEYMKQRKEPVDNIFTWSADYIIKNKIPRNVVGCTGTARVFSKLATEAGLDVFVVETARIADLNQENREINGHQIIAVYDKEGNLRAFDPGKQKLKYINKKITIGNNIDFVFGGEVIPHQIMAILTPEEFSKINTRQKLHDLDKSAHKQIIFNKGKNKIYFWEKLQNYFIKQND